MGGNILQYNSGAWQCSSGQLQKNSTFVCCVMSTTTVASKVALIIGVSVGTMLFNDVHTHSTHFLLEPLPSRTAALILIGGSVALFMRHRMRRICVRNYQVL